MSTFKRLREFCLRNLRRTVIFSFVCLPGAILRLTPTLSAEANTCSERICSVLFPLFVIVSVPLALFFSFIPSSTSVSEESEMQGACESCASLSCAASGSITAETPISFSSSTLSPGKRLRYTDVCVSPMLLSIRLLSVTCIFPLRLGSSVSGMALADFGRCISSGL